MPDINITLVIAIIGLGFTACDLFLRYKATKIEKGQIKFEEESKESKEPERKFGME